MRIDQKHYQLGAPPVSGQGLGISHADLAEALTGEVASLVFDDAGTDHLHDLLDGLADTEFSRENLDLLLADDGTPEAWRVGEALAECYLTDNQGCFFPWPDGRDERKRGSSLPGADLVGFQSKDGNERFAFGEVKTSSHDQYPPGLMYGRHGLKQQLEDLRDRRDIRDGLVRYLGYRATDSGWWDSYRNACSAYLRDTCDVRIFGLLVRDVPPHEDDLKARVSRLEEGCPANTMIELTALYLPIGSIASLPESIVASRTRGGES